MVPITLVQKCCIRFYLHIECQTHSSVKITDEDLDHAFDEGILSDQASVFRFEHLEEAVIYDSWQIAVFYKGHFIELLLLDGIR